MITTFRTKFFLILLFFFLLGFLIKFYFLAENKEKNKESFKMKIPGLKQVTKFLKNLNYLKHLKNLKPAGTPRT